MHLIDDAIALLEEMPTFAEAQVSEKLKAPVSEVLSQ